MSVIITHLNACKSLNNSLDMTWLIICNEIGNIKYPYLVKAQSKHRIRKQEFNYHNDNICCKTPGRLH